MDLVKLTCQFCAQEFYRCLIEHNKLIRESKNENYIIKCADCRPFKHGLHKSPEYRSWYAMKARCDNPNHKAYMRYGGRGITYDPKWKNFMNFINDMGLKPEPKMELDRIDNDKNYCKENCRWATKKEQTRNRGGKRATRLYTYDGKTMCIKDWADYVGIRPQSMQKRLNNNWPLEKAFKKQNQEPSQSENVLDGSKSEKSPIIPLAAASKVLANESEP